MPSLSDRDRTIHFGQIGCGRIAQTAHLPAFMKADGLRLEAVCDGDPGVARRVAQRFEVERVHEDVDALLADERLDAVVVAIPDQYHHSVVGRALEAGKHILVEKPLATSIEECRDLIDAAAERGLKLQVGAMKRYDPGVQFAHTFLREDAGELLSFSAWYHAAPVRKEIEKTIFRPLVQPPQDPRQDEYKAVREHYLLVTHGAHMFDSIRWLTGDDVATVTAKLVVRNGNYSWQGLCEMVGGTLGRFELAISVHGGWEEGFELHGANGSVRIDTHFPFYLRQSTVRAFDARAGEWRSPLRGDSDPYERQLEAFARAIADDGPPAPSGEDGLEVVRLLDAVETSVRTGAAVDLAPAAPTARV